MIPLGERQIKRHPVGFIAADQAKYRQIVEDMLQHGKELMPEPNWLLADARSNPAHSYNREDALGSVLNEEMFQRRFSKFEEMLPAWIGPEKTQWTSASTLEPYSVLFDGWDPLSLWEANIVHPPTNAQFMEADLGTLMDLSLIYAFSHNAGLGLTRILEVGGGYGRLAEAAWNVSGRTIQYVLIDSVPATLYFCAEYLRHACPDARIISFYDDSKDQLRDLRQADVAIIPAWHFAPGLYASKFDVCVNIQSFQEMNQFHVDHYLKLFDRATDEGAIIFLDNNHAYYFRGSWNYPAHWQKLLAINTPRWVTKDHPLEIFRKTSINFSSSNAALDATYRFSLWREWRGQGRVNDPNDLSRYSFGSLAAETLKRGARKAGRVCRKLISRSAAGS